MKKFFLFSQLTLFLFWSTTPALALSDKIYKELEVFSRIIEILDKEYVEPVDEHALIEGAIQGMLLSLDPYTVYLPPDLYKDFQSDTTGQFGGVGIEITVKDGVLTVVAPIEDSPAHRAGIRSGDRILKINGEATKGMGLIDAVHKMRGPRGKKVIITIWREGLNQPQDYAIIREIIQMESVKAELMDQAYAYVRITSFQEKTTDNLKKSLKDMEEKVGGVFKGMILDLRDNPGGLLSEAIRVSDFFMDGGLIVTTRGRDKEVDAKYAKKNSDFEKIPLIVLVNKGSASASEIVAGALQDSKRAKILGLTTFGKGSVQTLMELGDKEALKITIAKYYTPKGRSIDGKGIVPDMLLGQDQLKKDYPKKEEGKRPELSDYQKQKALDYLKRM